MKIYIDHFNLDILTSIMTSIEHFIISTETYIEAYTDSGIYQIDNYGVNQLKPVDSKFSIHKNYYNDFTIIVDPSYFVKEQVSNIIGHIIHNKTTKKYTYKMNKQSKLALIIEGNYKPVIDHPLESKFKPNNIYFEMIDNTFDLYDSFFKKELIEFLSVLSQ